MKKLFAIIALVGVLASPLLYGQDPADTAQAADPAPVEQPTETASSAPVEDEDQSFQEVLKDHFIAGGA